MDQRIINLFDEYTHKPLRREEFMERLTRLTGSTAAALAILPLLEVSYAKAETIDQQDDRLLIEKVVYAGDDQMNAYIARPKQDGKYPGVIVVHENRGLNPHIEDVTRRMALAGYLAIAPDALSPQGGTPADADKAREMIQKVDAVRNVNNFVKAIDFARSRPDCSGKVGAVGFCWGGRMANQLAVSASTLNATVAYYGSQPAAEGVPQIKAAVQLHYASLDERINAGIPAYEEALKKAGVTYELYMYEDAQHAFNNDTAPTRYNEAAAKLAWERTLAFFKKHLT
jgi:carboxymethylenebutenolidase